MDTTIKKHLRAYPKNTIAFHKSYRDNQLSIIIIADMESKFYRSDLTDRQGGTLSIAFMSRQ